MLGSLPEDFVAATSETFLSAIQRIFPWVDATSGLVIIGSSARRTSPGNDASGAWDALSSISARIGDPS